MIFAFAAIASLLIAPVAGSVEGSVAGPVTMTHEASCFKCHDPCSVPPTDADSFELIAGGGNEKSATDVGEVQVWKDGGKLCVRYFIDEYYCLLQTHLAVADGLAGIPQTGKGNPIPGQFDYSEDHDCVLEYTYAVDADCGEKLVVAAHAVVQETPWLEEFENWLPDTVSMKIVGHLQGNSYFDFLITNGGNINGSHDGFCVDLDNFINIGPTYTEVDVYSSYDEDLQGSNLVNYPKNLPLVNYILNKYYNDPMYTLCDVQKAIWEVIDGATSSCGPSDPGQVAVIREDAYANGVGFVPGCDDYVGIILDPGTSIQVQVQVQLFPLMTVCEDEYHTETAWGDGTAFVDGKKSWATYFTYDCEDAPARLLRGGH